VRSSIFPPHNWVNIELAGEFATMLLSTMLLSLSSSLCRILSVTLVDRAMSEMSEAPCINASVIDIAVLLAKMIVLGIVTLWTLMQLSWFSSRLYVGGAQSARMSGAFSLDVDDP